MSAPTEEHVSIPNVDDNAFPTIAVTDEAEPAESPAAAAAVEDIAAAAEEKAAAAEEPVQAKPAAAPVAVPAPAPVPVPAPASPPARAPAAAAAATASSPKPAVATKTSGNLDTSGLPEFLTAGGIGLKPADRPQSMAEQLEVTAHDKANTANVAVLLQSGEFKLKPLQDFVPIEKLKAMRLEDGIDATRKEDYVADSEFTGAFGTDRAGFAKLPKWKQAEAKKKLGLY